jgi:hypothetical protein
MQTRDPLSFQSISPIGIALDFTPTPTGYSSTPSQVMPDATWSGSGQGLYSLDPGVVLGRRGSIEISGYSGNSASPQAIFDLYPASQNGISVRMTAGRALTVIHRDILGTVVAEVVLSTTYSVAKQFVLRYVWDSQNFVVGDKHAAVFLDRELDAAATWVTAASNPWEAEPMDVAAINGRYSFQGRVDKVQISNSVQLVPDYTQIVLEHAGSHLYANSVLAAAAKVKYAMSGNLTVNSSVAADPGVNWLIDAAIAANSSVAADATVTP